MEKRIAIYLKMLISSLMLTSCVSYETASSSGVKNSSSERYSYNSSASSGTSSKKSQSKSTKSTKSTNPTKSTASKKETKSETKPVTLKSDNTSSSKSKEIKLVLNEAEKYKGTPYKYGGTTSSGMDCSGLVCTAFQKIDLKLPRRSIDMSNEGSSVNVSNVKEGDLLFFATGGGSINHVAIVYNVSSSGEISFIHASTSKGVTISSLEETYWKGKFIKAKRVL